MRFFFALWPDDALRLKLTASRLELARRSGGKPIVPITLHMTLAFADDVPESRIADLKEIGNQINTSPFELCINVARTYDQAGIATLGCTEVPRRLLKLQETLQSAILKAGFAPDTRAFRPHVTVAREVKHTVPKTPIEPVHWAVDTLTLIHLPYSDPLAKKEMTRYEPVQLWPLEKKKN